MAKKLVADGRGGFVEIEKSESGAAPEAAPAAAPATAPASAPAAAEPAAAASAAELEKQADIQKLSAVAERVIGVIKAYRDANEDVPADFVAEVSSMLELIPVVKRRMGKGRMDKFQKGLDELSSLLKELKGEEEVDTAKGAAPAAAAPAAPAAAPVTKSATEVELEKKLADQEAEIKKLREMPGRSNGGSAEETTGSGSSGAGASFSWPTDMAAPDRDPKKRAF